MTFGGSLLEYVWGEQCDDYFFSNLQTVLQKSSLLLLGFLTSTCRQHTLFFSVTHLNLHAFIYGWYTLIYASMSPQIWLRVVLECLGNMCIVCPLFLFQAHENAGKRQH